MNVKSEIGESMSTVRLLSGNRHSFASTSHIGSTVIKALSDNIRQLQVKPADDLFRKALNPPLTL